jgi:hypothetical protein
MNELIHWDFTDWQDPDKARLNEEFILIVSIFSVVVLAAFFLGLAF